MRIRTAPSFFASILLVGAFVAGGAARADPTIVNIDGAGPDGAGVATGYGYPLAPGSPVSLIHPVVVALAAGDYTVSDAWGLRGALYDAWNYQVAAPGSWDSHFYVAVEEGTSAVYRLLVDGLSVRDPACTYHHCSWATEADASAAFLRTPAFAFHLDAATDVSFSSTDYYLADDAGGISLAVAPVASQTGAVPEPDSIALLLLGSLPLVRRLRRSRSDLSTRGRPFARAQARPNAIASTSASASFA